MNSIIIIASIIIISFIVALILRINSLSDECNVLKKKHIAVIEINTERQQENEQLDREVQQKKEEIESLRSQVLDQNEVLSKLTETAESLRGSAEQQANELYRTRIADLRQDYQSVYEGLDSELQKRTKKVQEKIDQEQAKLADLEAKQLAYIKAQQRQEQIAADQDYYRLALDKIEIGDIEMLRDIQPRFIKKESIDKLIWETYYKPAFDILTARLFDTPGKICGIYKITDLTTGQAYIGQSVDIKERFRSHIKSSLAYGKSTNKLYQTMSKSGQYNFTFEILEEVPRAQLNEREIYWIDFYKTKEFGLNSTKGGS